MPVLQAHVHCQADYQSVLQQGALWACMRHLVLKIGELCARSGWWFRPDYIINDININSVVSSPAHDEVCKFSLKPLVLIRMARSLRQLLKVM